MRPEQEQLEDDQPIEALLAGFIDDAHAAVADLIQEFVVSKVADLPEARRRAVCGLGLSRVWLVLERRRRGFAEAQTVEAPGTEPFRGVGREFRAAARTCVGI